MTGLAALWHGPSERLILRAMDVHLWRAALDMPDAQRDLLAGTLSDDEHARAERLHFARDRRRFVAARGILRALLGAYLGVEPRLLQFTYGAHGKPALASTHGDAWLSFNLAHSDELALYALARRRPVGVDVERMRPIDDAGGIVARFFSSREQTMFGTLPPDRQQAAFFTWWTRKEAYVKARGDGLAHPLDCFDVALSPDEPAALLATHDDPGEAARWSLRDIAPSPGYAAALAVAGQDWQLDCYHWPENGLPGVLSPVYASQHAHL